MLRLSDRKSVITCLLSWIMGLEIPMFYLVDFDIYSGIRYIFVCLSYFDKNVSPEAVIVSISAGVALQTVFIIAGR